MNWQFHSFQTLDTQALFNLMKLRVDVFVVEQCCAYPELDRYDTEPDTVHLLGYDSDQLVAYARAMPSDKNATQACVRIGRVVVSKSHRASGLSQSLMSTLLARLESDFPAHDQFLSAQDAVKQFYATFGFECVSDVYPEDGIPHIDMRRQAADFARSGN